MRNFDSPTSFRSGNNIIWFKICSLLQHASQWAIFWNALDGQLCVAVKFMTLSVKHCRGASDQWYLLPLGDYMLYAIWLNCFCIFNLISSVCFYVFISALPFLRLRRASAYVDDVITRKVVTSQQILTDDVDATTKLRQCIVMLMDGVVPAISGLCHVVLCALCSGPVSYLYSSVWCYWWRVNTRDSKWMICSTLYHII